MSTPKFDMGVADWRPPSRDVIANLSYVQLRQDFDYSFFFGNLGIYVEQSLGAYREARMCASINPSLPTDEGSSLVMPMMDPYGPSARIVELFHRGDYRKVVEWSIVTTYAWMDMSKTSGELSIQHPAEHLDVSIDSSNVPTNFSDTVQLRVEWDLSPP